MSNSLKGEGCNWEWLCRQWSNQWRPTTTKEMRRIQWHKMNKGEATNEEAGTATLDHDQNNMESFPHTHAREREERTCLQDCRRIPNAPLVGDAAPTTRPPSELSEMQSLISFYWGCIYDTHTYIFRWKTSVTYGELYTHRTHTNNK